jgi:hypothetical protein
MIKNRYIILNKYQIREIVEFYRVLFELLKTIKDELSKAGLFVDDDILAQVVFSTLPQLLKDVKEKR